MKISETHLSSMIWIFSTASRTGEWPVGAWSWAWSWAWVSVSSWKHTQCWELNCEPLWCCIHAGERCIASWRRRASSFHDMPSWIETPPGQRVRKSCNLYLLYSATVMDVRLGDTPVEHIYRFNLVTEFPLKNSPTVLVWQANYF